MVAEAKPSLITNVPPSFYAQSDRATDAWLSAKRRDDNVEDGLWRIHNTLYDLTDFIDKHPGGPMWLEMTKGHSGVTRTFVRRGYSLLLQSIDFPENWVPSKEAKNWIQRYVSYIYVPIFYCFLYLYTFSMRMLLSIVKGHKVHINHFLPFIVPITMYLFGGNHTLIEALKIFSIIILSGSFMFSIIALNADHHHPEVVHDGDPVRKSYDWGLYSVDTIMDRQELRGNTLLTLTNFGDHALHHLFPTLDHGILPELYDDFFATLLEFEAECQCYPWFFETIKGQFQQLSRIETMKLDSHERYLLKHGRQMKSK
ncbi:cytochrome b5-related protein-like [Sitodiplosis mosellana]|uniref:cytochrome b5-related protein-like n=1 Tax=Sitodiplosis mosellana TaxID=263140 RepID=UPI002444FD91|nr:cytochrome b5-related protein-like [Sitodiplosis mosellana]